MKPMSVEDILQGAKESEKTAAAPIDSGISQDRLVASVTGVMETLSPGEKTAAVKTAPESPQDPEVAGTLLKMAADLAGAENAGAVKEAQVFGAAMMDGAMTRLAEWNQAAEATSQGQGEKTAADVAFENAAAQNPEQIKTAAQQGYTAVMQGMQGLQKEASAEEALLKLATGAYERGYRDMAKVATYIQQSAS